MYELELRLIQLFLSTEIGYVLVQNQSARVTENLITEDSDSVRMTVDRENEAYR